MIKRLLFLLLPFTLVAQDITRDWSDTTLIVENVTVSGVIAGDFQLEFESVAEMKAFDFSSTANGSRVKCNGYSTANDGFFGPDVFWVSASTATDDGLSVFDPDISGAGRLERSFDKGISATWSGYNPTADGVETSAAANDTAWGNLKTYLDASPNTVTIPRIEGKVFYYSADQEASADCTYVLNGTIKKKQDAAAVGFEVPSGVDNVTLTGSGAIHGNAVVDQVRAGGNGIRATDNDNFNILGRIQIYHCEGHAVNIRQPVNCTIDGLYVRNTYGSVKSGSTNSGVNMDGIHLYNPTEVVVRNCDIKSIDDGLAITMLEAYTNETSGVIVSDCLIEVVKAENTAGAGDGSAAKVLGAGIRVTQEDSETLCRLRDVTISGCFIKGGVAGMKLGATGLVVTTKFVERLQVSDMHFVDVANKNYGDITAFADAGGGQVTVTSAGHAIAENDLVSIAGTTSYNGDFTATNVAANTFEITDTWVADDATGKWVSNPDFELNRATSAGIFARSIKDAVFSNITFNNIGVNAIRAGILDNVEFNNITSIGGVIDNGNDATSQEWERAHFLITGTHNPSDRVYLRNFRSVDADGAGLAIVHNGGAGKEITNLYVSGTVDNPNFHVGSNVRHSAVYLEGMDPEEIAGYDVEVINFTPSGDVIDIGKTSSSIYISKLGPISIQAWHSDIYAAAGNWFNRLQLFTPTYTVTNHFEGLTNVLKVAQGSTDISGTAAGDGGGSDTIELAAGTSTLNDSLVGFTINTTGGTGPGQSKTITDFDGSTQVATLDSDWGVAIDATTTYDILEAGGDGIYSAPLAGGAITNKHICAEYYIHIDAGSVNIIEDSNVTVIAETLTDTGEWYFIKKIWAPDSTSTDLGGLQLKPEQSFI